MSDLKASLASQIKGTVLTPQDVQYEERVKRWAGNAEKRAAYIVLVESPEDIAKTVSPQQMPLSYPAKHPFHTCPIPLPSQLPTYLLFPSSIVIDGLELY